MFDHSVSVAADMHAAVDGAASSTHNNLKFCVYLMCHRAHGCKWHIFCQSQASRTHLSCPNGSELLSNCIQALATSSSHTNTHLGRADGIDLLVLQSLRGGGRAHRRRLGGPVAQDDVWQAAFHSKMTLSRLQFFFNHAAVSFIDGNVQAAITHYSSCGAFTHDAGQAAFQFLHLRFMARHMM